MVHFGEAKGATVGYWRTYCCAPSPSRGIRPAGASVQRGWCWSGSKKRLDWVLQRRKNWGGCESPVPKSTASCLEFSPAKPKYAGT
jgi:hypothetical protein